MSRSDYQTVRQGKETKENNDQKAKEKRAVGKRV
jgi:hypothetical protein